MQVIKKVSYNLRCKYFLFLFLTNLQLGKVHKQLPSNYGSKQHHLFYTFLFKKCESPLLGF